MGLVPSAPPTPVQADTLAEAEHDRPNRKEVAVQENKRVSSRVRRVCPESPAREERHPPVAEPLRHTSGGVHQRATTRGASRASGREGSNLNRGGTAVVETSKVSRSGEPLVSAYFVA